MNPHVYSRRKRVAVDPEPPVPATTGSIMKDILHAKLSSAVAFAFVLFAAGSVASMTAIAYSDIAMADDSGTVLVTTTSSRAQVLGESVVVEVMPIVEDTLLEALEPEVKLVAKPISYNSNGRWNYNIGFVTKNFSGTGKITIGKYVLTSTTSPSGYIETGAILKPSTLYRVYFWGDDGTGNIIKLQSIEIKTAKEKNKPEECGTSIKKCPPIFPVTKQEMKCTNDQCLPKPCKSEKGCPPVATSTPAIITR